MTIWRKIAAAGLISMVVGCGNSSGGGETPSMRQSSLDAVVSMSIATPTGTSIDGVFLSGSNSLIVDDRVTLAKAGQLPAVSGLGAGGVQLGSNLIGYSNVFSGGPTSLRSNLHVFGSVKSAGAITVQDPVVVDGGRTSGVSVGSLVTSFSVTFPGTTLGDKVIGPDGPIVTLAPGAYGALDLRSRGKVLLRAGKYYFDSFSSEPQAQFQVDPTGGTTFIFVRNSFNYKSPITSSTSAAPSLVVGYVGTSLAYLQAGFPGVFMAPNATLELHRPDLGTYIGAFFARDLHVFSDTAVGFNSFGTPLLCALGDTDHCQKDPVPDSDGDGPDDLHEGCPNDRNKTEPGQCNCGVSEVDRDHDKTPDCIDLCPDDPNNTFPGPCGCTGPGQNNLQPAGVACTVEACSGSGQQATCDGQGQCGVPACTLPPSQGCVFRTFRDSGYLICSGAVSWDQAETLCQQEPGRSLVEVDDRAENLWLANAASNGAWVGGNNRVDTDTWAWSYNGARNRRPFWQNGLPVPYRFLNWHAGAPATGQCLTLGKDGTWTDAACAATHGFVCEQPLRRLPRKPGPVCPCQFFPGLACDRCGKTDNVPAGPCVDGATEFPSDHLLPDGGLDQEANFEETKNKALACHDHCANETDPECASHCTGFAAVPPPGSCRPFSGEELSRCSLVPSSLVAGATCSVANPTSCPVGSTCGKVYDCAALDGAQQPVKCQTNADCASGQPCDPTHHYCIDPARLSACADKDGAGKCVGVCFGRFACGQVGPDCPSAGEDTLLQRCSTTEICPDPGTVATNIDPFTDPNSNLSTTPFPAADLFPEPDPTTPATPYPVAKPDGCGGPGEPACTFAPTKHPWCTYKVADTEAPPPKAISDKSPPFSDKQGTGGGGGPIRFDFDPNLDISYNFGSPLTLGDTNFDARAQASATAGAHFSLFGIDGDVEVLNALGRLHVDRCGFDNDATLQLFGIDFLPTVLGDDIENQLRSANTSPEERKTCTDTLDKIQKLVNRAQKSLRDAQELIRQEKDLVTNGQRYSPDLCHQILEAADKGVPANFPTPTAPFKSCADLSPEETVNLFIRYYKQQVIEMKDQLSDLLKLTAPKIPTLSIGFADDPNKPGAHRETQQIANINFAIGPIPMNLTIEAYVEYGLAGNLTLALTPQAIVNTVISNTNEDLARVNATFTPFAGAGVSMFVGVGFDFGALSAKVGISGDVSLGVVSLPLHAGAGVKLEAANDERPLPADLQGMVANGNMLYPQGPPRKFRLNAYYDFGAEARISNILVGTIYGKLRIKFFWFSKTWQKQIAQFNPGFPEVDKVLISGEGNASVASSDLGFLGFLHMPIQFVDLAELPTPDPLPPLPTGGGGAGGGGAGGGGAGGSSGSGSSGAGAGGVSGRPPVSLQVMGDPRYKDFDASRVDRLFYAGFCECSNDGACTSNLDCCDTTTCIQNDEKKAKSCDQCVHTSTFEHQGQRCSKSADCCASTDHCEVYGNVAPNSGAPTYCQVCVADHHAMKTHNVSIVPDYPDECCPGLTQFNAPRFINKVWVLHAGSPICHACEPKGNPCNDAGDCCKAGAICTDAHVCDDPAGPPPT